jgi:hypothetical protein
MDDVSKVAETKISTLHTVLSHRKNGYGWIAFLLALYQVTVGLFAAATLASLIFTWPPSTLATITTEPSSSASLLRLCVAMVAGATLGAVLHGLVGLHLHAAVLGDFSIRFVGSYIIGPFGAALLGTVFFFVLQGGLMALGGDNANSTGAEVRATMFHAAVGALTGFAFDTVVLRLDSVARQIFGEDRESSLSAALRRATAREAESEKPSPAGKPS